MIFVQSFKIQIVFVLTQVYHFLITLMSGRALYATEKNDKTLLAF